MSSETPDRYPECGRSGAVADRLLTGMFLVAITLPLVLARGMPSDTRIHPVVEKVLRLLRIKSRPAFLKDFPHKYGSPFTTRFGLRDELVTAHGLLKVRGFGVSSSSGVVLGKHGWLFYAWEGSLDEYRRTSPLTPSALRQWGQIFEAHREWLARRGIPYLLVITPSKHTIYPEEMPEAYTRVRDQSRYDQLLNHLQRTNPSLEVVDLCPALLAAKRRDRLYFQTDTHWNNSGAFVGYRVLAERLRKKFPELHPLERGDFRVVELQDKPGDLARLLSLQRFLREPAPHWNPIRPFRARDESGAISTADPTNIPFDWRVTNFPRASIPRAVIFRDSFFSQVKPFLAEHIGHAVYEWTYTFDRATVEREHPDVVIEQLAERRLMVDPPPPGI